MYKNLNSFSYFDNLILRFIFSCLISLVYALNIWLFFEVNPFSTTSQISLTFKMQLIFIIYLICINLIIFYKFASNNSRFKLFLDTCISLIVGYIVAAEIMSLKGAPLQSPIFGDTKKYIELIYLYDNYNYLSPEVSYPPLWFITQAFLSDIFDTNIFDIYKYVNLIFPIFFGNLFHRIVQVTFGSILGSIISFHFIFSLIVWREFAVISTIPLLIFILTNLLSKSKTNNENYLNFDFLFLGLFLGLVVSLYYSELYFTFPGILLFLIFMIGKEVKFRLNLIKSLLDLLLGVMLSFGFLVLRPMLQITNLEFLSLLLLLVLLKLSIIFLFRSSHKLIMLIFFLGSILLFSIFVKIDIGDRYIYDGIDQNLVFNPKIDSTIILLLIIFLFSISLTQIFLSEKFTNILMILTLFFFSSFCIKYLQGSYLEQSGKVNLFTRADNVLYISWNITLFIFIYAIIAKFMNIKIELLDFKLFFKTNILVSIMILIALYSLHGIYSYQDSSWPTKNEWKKNVFALCENQNTSFDSAEIQNDYISYISKKC